VELKADGRQSETALGIQRGLARLLRAHNFAHLTEFTLASGRRADIMAVGPEGLIWIIEIKSSIEDFRADNKWPEYREYCDRFSFAIPTHLEPDIMPDEAGLIVADPWGAEIMRHVDDHPLHASRRRALLLSFARNAALRLSSLTAPLTP
jgi:hypothetical protein